MSDRRDLLVGADDEAPTAGERLRASRVGTALLAHPWRSLAATGALVLAAGAIALVVTRPPAFDDKDAGLRLVRTGQAVSLELDPGPAYGAARPDGRHVLGATVWVARTVPGDDVDVIGVAGPGLSVQRVIDPVRDHDREAPVRVLEVADCSDDWWAAAPDDYALVVERTDAWGRTAQVPLPLGEGGRTWQAAVRGACAPVDAWLLSVAGWSTDAAPGRPDVVVRWRLHNPQSHPVWVQAAGLYRDSAVDTPPVQIPPGREATVPAPAAAVRCPDDVRVLDLPSGTGGPAPTAASTSWWLLGVRVAPQPWSTVDVDAGHEPDPAVVPIAPQVADEVVGAVQHVCDGAPAVRAQVMAMHPVATIPPEKQWRVVLELSSSAQWLAVESELTEPRPSRVALRDGRARVAATWTMPGCEYLDEFPLAPELVVVAESGARRYPVAPAFDARPLLAAARSTCTGRP